MLRKVIAAAAIITLLSASAALAGGLLSPAKILGDPVLQEDPAGNGTYFGWSENSQAHPGRYNAYSSDDRGQTKQRVNRAGTRGFFGDMDQELGGGDLSGGLARTVGYPDDRPGDARPDRSTRCMATPTGSAALATVAGNMRVCSRRP